jgi:iron complex transport system ATP-binding protein
MLAETRSVAIELGGRRVIDDVSVQVRAGELVALIGPNGAGKSTLLGAIAGDLAPEAGEVSVDDAPVDDWSATELAMRRSVLPQSVTVSFPFSTRDVVRMGRAPWARSTRADRDDDAIAAALQTTDVAHLAGRSYTTLSGGERARVALARVLAQEAQLVLLDEPTAALDVHHQELVLGVAREHTGRGDGVVVVLHDLAVAARHVHRVVLMAAGRVIADGAPDEVFEPTLLSHVYDHDIEVLRHPQTGALLVVPRAPLPGRTCPDPMSM